MNTKNHYDFRTPNPADYPLLRDVWEEAVRQSHHFLSEKDIQFYREQMIPHYFPNINLLCAYDENHCMGFIGWQENHIEMLFVSPSHWKRGVGSALLNYVLPNGIEWTLDVNEDNSQAYQFYQSYGFVQIGRSEVDHQGNPFPLCHMKINQK